MIFICQVCRYLFAFVALNLVLRELKVEIICEKITLLVFMNYDNSLSMGFKTTKLPARKTCLTTAMLIAHLIYNGMLTYK